ncbi:uncharacterized protein B0H18DRAFT_822407, partial [Fomitopsis serialis]|uniref:uncharacterized protein n=1 Tax=Fomitopsis serialis TaxID=139415 RepID=UPI0020087806
LSLVHRCRRMKAGKSCVDFMLIVHLMQLVCKCTSMQRVRMRSVCDIYEQHVRGFNYAPSQRTFLHWNQNGGKFATIASGGSIYALILIAEAGLRSTVVKSIGDFASKLANVLRDPDPDTPAGKQVIEHVIPAISSLRQSLPLRFDTMFSPGLLAELKLSSDSLTCSDLRQSDQVFDSLLLNNFTEVDRNWGVWATCLDPVEHPAELGTIALTHASQSLFRPEFHVVQDHPSPMTVDDEDDDVEEDSEGSSTTPDSPCATVTIAGLDLEEESLLANPVPKSPEDAFAWTETQRALAQSAEEPETLEELQDLDTLPWCRLFSGVLFPHDPSSKLFHLIILSEPLRISDSRGGLVASVYANMPDHLKQRLMANLIACFEDQPENLQHMCSASQGAEFSFPALHYAWYNRHGTRGHGISAQSHPMLIEKDGNSRTNYAQMLPYVSADMRKHSDIYEILEATFSEVLEYMAEQIMHTLPDEYDELRLDAEVLPGNAHSIAHPFLSLVVNINVATLAH